MRKTVIDFSGTCYGKQIAATGLTDTNTFCEAAPKSRTFRPRGHTGLASTAVYGVLRRECFGVFMLILPKAGRKSYACCFPYVQPGVSARHLLLNYAPIQERWKIRQCFGIGTEDGGAFR